MSLSPLDASHSTAAVFTPIKSGGLVEEVCKRIELAVESGLLKSGQRLPNEIEMSASLGVSAVTVREALALLRDQGLIRTTRGRNGGSFVTENSFPSEARTREKLLSLTPYEIADISLHLQAISVACAGAAALRAGPEDIASMRSHLRPEESLDEADAMFAWRREASEFMLAVAMAARSARMARELWNLQSDAGTLSMLPFEDPNFCELTATLNESITNAIEAQDPIAAEARMRDLCMAGNEWLLAEYAREADLNHSL
ncbi:FadR/GntR family transcriptional regulator [Arthrobacter sp. GMC3]|uniref:FadR/GntR family transcriptional regulator n=1 Tax=Arthrobacter sp. GMC3 TaxID=2058894 RepID=UPI0015E47BB9|nr:GntR family transcriptional regulator [Arthrobacter sp. GMC3]